MSWIALTDEDRDRAMQQMPDMLDGFMKLWGWLHFAKAIEATCREKNSMPTVTAEHVRQAGGIVHSDGNVFFTNVDKLNAAVLAAMLERGQQ